MELRQENGVMSGDLREFYRLMLKSSPAVNIRTEDESYYIHLMYPSESIHRLNALFIADFWEGCLVKS